MGSNSPNFQASEVPLEFETANLKANITVIFTRHQAVGKCNFEELWKIIKIVKPDIIFEELSQANFRKCYQGRELSTVETRAIQLYLMEHPIDHIPVDTLVLPQHYEEKRDQMYERIKSEESLRDTREFLNILNHQVYYVEHYGFNYLNSSYNDMMMERSTMVKQRILAQLNQAHLFEIDYLDQQVIDMREDEMLANVYSYCEQHSFYRGLFFIGSGHRKSMLQKIGIANEAENRKVDWTIYDPLRIL